MVSIIIPTLNEEDYLPDLLNCLKNQTFKDFEIIIADANSTDKTREIAVEFGCKVIEGGIQAIGRNNGALVAKYDILVFIDSDVRFGPYFLENAINQLKDRKLDFAIPYFFTSHKKLRFRVFFTWSNVYKRIMQYTKYPDGTGQLVIANKKKFLEIGGFPILKVAEDTLLFWTAARKNGYKVGTINEKIYSSTRRLEKIGLFWAFFVWGIIGFAMGINIAKTKRFQELASNLYGGLTARK
jgi:glycosyltransferase involved in cell wall biosynthesis